MTGKKRRFRATKDFMYPATPADLQLAIAGAELSEITFTRVKRGAVLDEPPAVLLRSWQANECVEEVK